MTSITFAAPADATRAYADADAAEKARIRAYADAAIRDAIRDANLSDAMEWTAARDAMRTEKAPVVRDYGRDIADMRATLVAAVAAIDAGAFVMPDGATAPVVDDIDFSAGTVDAATVTRLTTVSGRKAGRGDVASYVATVCDAPMTIAQLRAAHVDGIDGYPVDPPSAGALGAYANRIDGDDDAPFIVVSIDGKRGIAPRR